MKPTKTTSDSYSFPYTNELLPAFLNKREIDINNNHNSSRALSNYNFLQNRESKSLFETWLIDLDRQVIISNILRNFSLQNILFLRLVSTKLYNLISDLKINQESSLLDLLVNKTNFAFQAIELFPNAVNDQLEFCIKNKINIILKIFDTSDIKQFQTQLIESPNTELFSKITELDFPFFYNEPDIKNIETLLTQVSENPYFRLNLKILVFENSEGIQLPSLPNLKSLSISNFNFSLQQKDSLNQIKDLKISHCDGDPKLLESFPNLETLSFENFRCQLKSEDDLKLIESLTLPEFQTIEEPLNIRPKIVKLPDSLKSLKNLYIKEISRSAILELPQSLPNLAKLIIEKYACNIILPDTTFDNLIDFSLGFNPEDNFILPILNNLQNFSCENFSEKILSCIYGSLEIIKNLSIQNIITPLRLPDLLTNLIELNIGTIASNLQLPNKLDKLCTLHIGEIQSDAIVTFPDKLDNLSILCIEDINNFNLVSLLPNLANLKRLTIQEISNKNDYAYDSDDYFCSNTMEYDINKNNGKLTLPLSITNLSIQRIAHDNVSIDSAHPSNLDTILIENIASNTNLILNGSFNHLTSLTIGTIAANTIFKLGGSLNNLKIITIKNIDYGATLEITNSLDELITLQIENIQDDSPVTDDDGYESPFLFTPGATLKLLGQLPKLKHLVICNNQAIEVEGKFSIDCQDSPILRILETINAQIPVKTIVQNNPLVRHQARPIINGNMID